MEAKPSNRRSQVGTSSTSAAAGETHIASAARTIGRMKLHPFDVGRPAPGFLQSTARVRANQGERPRPMFALAGLVKESIRPRGAFPAGSVRTCSKSLDVGTTN